jgi:nicotinamide riboside kinase
MKVAIVGAHGVGKTTLAKELIPKLNLKHVPDTAAEAFHKGFEVNENTPPENQFWILCKQLEYEREHQNDFIADKALYDNIVYSKHIFEDPHLLRIIKEIVLKNAKYDHLLYIPIEIPLVDDGRSMNLDFQKKIDQEYKHLLHELDLKFHEIKGSVEERVDQALQILSPAPSLAFATIQ